jgi:hypothetical protein
MIEGSMQMAKKTVQAPKLKIKQVELQLGKYMIDHEPALSIAKYLGEIASQIETQVLVDMIFTQASITKYIHDWPDVEAFVNALNYYLGSKGMPALRNHFVASLLSEKGNLGRSGLDYKRNLEWLIRKDAEWLAFASQLARQYYPDKDFKDAADYMEDARKNLKPRRLFSR